MAKKDNTVWIIVGVAVVILLLIGPQLGWFSITGGEAITRNFYEGYEVEPGGSVKVRYMVTGTSGNWAASVSEILFCPGYADEWHKIVLLQEGQTISNLYQSYQLPDEPGLVCEICGDYQFGNQNMKDLGCVEVYTKGAVCASGADSNNDRVVSLSELWVVANKWITNTETRTKLGEVIMDWAQGCGNW